MARTVDTPGWCAFPTYVLLVVAFSWTVWLVGVPLTSGLGRLAVVLLGGWGPTLVAVGLTARRSGRAGVRALIARLGRWRAPPVWYAVALLTVPASAVLAAGLWVVAGGTVPAPTLPGGLGAWAIPLVFLVNVLVGGALAEELGWRGYLQPLVAERTGTVGAGGIVGLVWALWHLPFYRLPTGTGVVAGFPFWAFLPLLVVWSVLVALLVDGSGGSVLLAVLFHASVNTTLGTLGVVDTDRPGLVLAYVVVQSLLVGVLGVVHDRHRRQRRSDRDPPAGAES